MVLPIFLVPVILNNDIGLSLKVTIFGRGSIWFDKNPASQKIKSLKKENLKK